jgi:hypothetical protein
MVYLDILKSTLEAYVNVKKYSIRSEYVRRMYDVCYYGLKIALEIDIKMVRNYSKYK